MSERIGILCEGKPNGEDQRVLSLLASRIRPDAAIQCVPLGSKPDLLRDCGAAAKAFIESGVHRVLIVFDLVPNFGRGPCMKRDRDEAFASLATEDLGNHPCIFVVTVHKELEAWLLADGSALSNVLSRPAHVVRINDRKKAEQDANPKGRLRRLFQQHGRLYTAPDEAIKIAKAIPHKFGALNHCPSFKRFGLKLTQAC